MCRVVRRESLPAMDATAADRSIGERNRQQLCDGHRPAISTHLIVLPGSGYAVHAAHEAEPVVAWLADVELTASVFRYPLRSTGVRVATPRRRTRPRRAWCR
jgi:hypothetical protein